jgi:hypothetical protein
MSGRPLLLLCLLCTIGGGAMTKALWPRIAVQTKVVEHNVVVEKIVNKTTTVTKPDGTTIVTSHTTENRVDTDTKQVSSTQAKSEVRKDWLVSVGMQLDRTSKSYTISVNRRILGPIYLGGSAATNGVVGFHLGVEF